ncbi:mannose-6-phosphate isomerase, class I [Agrococcus sp. HG114]|uniref:mannose-6-phosphate isomerase, class I n=1 Tax=Agrococcus sp. HG114 TaxID=2969757 RepID=UPI00215ADB13|nr:mannose-6-phosphate isomerase, class I [Agrococcus sp. HG114]MCR8670417.1 mannose-6-phosphate isomerase, class I [Agrococcus sp. HG114]
MLVRITNEPRDYAWGSDSAISDYLGLAATGRPQAELWLGAHPACPARVDGRGLDAVLTEAGLEQPRILLKVLAASRPLSLQAHPDADQAAAGFAREDAEGVPRDSPLRTYRDPYAKPELVVAVSRFEALSGFRPVERSIHVLDELAGLDRRVAPFAERVRSSLAGAVGWMLAAGDDARSAVRAITDAAGRLPAVLAAERDTVERLAAVAPDDPAIAIALLLHRVSLAPGDGLFLPAGNLHAYLEGLAIELMGPSDNVVRGGLTAKHVDREELLRILDIRAIDEPRIGRRELPGALAWRPDAPFELRHVEGAHRVVDGGQAVVLARRAVRVEVDGERLDLAPGEGAFASSARGMVLTGDDAWVAIADPSGDDRRIAA